MQKQLYSYINYCNLLTNGLFGVRKDLSTTDALRNLVDRSIVDFGFNDYV